MPDPDNVFKSEYESSKQGDDDDDDEIEGIEDLSLDEDSD
tara:strand:- start:4385 stop:4504 length:120 start_codon:yes stop_codon:yes gene_type:complete